jgi:hypothetical protein
MPPSRRSRRSRRSSRVAPKKSRKTHRKTRRGGASVGARSKIARMRKQRYLLSSKHGPRNSSNYLGYKASNERRKEEEEYDREFENMRRKNANEYDRTH